VRPMLQGSAGWPIQELASQPTEAKFDDYCWDRPDVWHIVPEHQNRVASVRWMAPDDSSSPVYLGIYR
jgi:hypothetical protein